MAPSSLRPTAYDDLATPAEMHDDCRAAGAHLRLEQAVRPATGPAPSIRFDEPPTGRATSTIDFSAAAARLAGALHFHLE